MIVFITDVTHIKNAWHEKNYPIEVECSDKTRGVVIFTQNLNPEGIEQPTR